MQTVDFIMNSPAATAISLAVASYRSALADMLAADRSLDKACSAQPAKSDTGSLVALEAYRLTYKKARRKLQREGKLLEGAITIGAMELEQGALSATSRAVLINNLSVAVAVAQENGESFPAAEKTVIGGALRHNASQAVYACFADVEKGAGGSNSLFSEDAANRMADAFMSTYASREVHSTPVDTVARRTQLILSLCAEVESVLNPVVPRMPLGVDRFQSMSAFSVKVVSSSENTYSRHVYRVAARDELVRLVQLLGEDIPGGITAVVASGSVPNFARSVIVSGMLTCIAGQAAQGIAQRLIERLSNADFDAVEADGTERELLAKIDSFVNKS